MKFYRDSLRDIIFAAALAFCLLAQNACKKEEATITSTDLLTSHGWVISKAEAQVLGMNYDITDTYVEPCAKDDVVTFSPDGVYKKTVGADDCDGTESAQEGTWQWKIEGKLLTFLADGTSTDVEIITLTQTTLKGSLGKMGYDLDGDGKDDLEGTITITSVEAL